MCAYTKSQLESEVKHSLSTSHSQINIIEISLYIPAKHSSFRISLASSAALERNSLQASWIEWCRQCSTEITSVHIAWRLAKRHRQSEKDSRSLSRQQWAGAASFWLT